jgi:hypothetical protein
MGYQTGLKAIGCSLLILIIHYVAVHLYAHICVPLTLWGAFQSIFTTASPPCYFMLMIANRTSEMHTATWVTFTYATFNFIKEFLTVKPTKTVKNENDTE